MLNYVRDKNKGRAGTVVGMGERSYMTPDLRYTTERARVMRASQ